MGASAGGLEAFTQLLRHLPADTGCAFVFIQHLAPDQPSHLPGLLAQVTPMPVVEAADDLPLKPNQVYVLPPKRRLTIAQGVLRSAPRGPAGQPAMPIDEFCQSLARDRGPRAIGVILSGTATDGTVGLEAIKAAGGTTFAQDEGSAKFQGMPHSAAEAGVVDIVLPPEAIARELARLSQHGYVNQARRPPAAPEDLKPVEQAALRQIRSLLKRQTDIDFAPYKETTLGRRVERRMMLVGVKGMAHYAEYLTQHPDEVTRLQQDAFIHVTSFFRDRAVYETLQRKVFPHLVEKRASGTPVRVWAPGCSTGEEVYSLAMAWLEFAEGLTEPVPAQFFGTDISAAAINQARTGRYGTDAAERVSPERLRRFLVEVPGGYQIARPVRKLCVFAKHDLFQDPPFTQLDLVCCRNVLIFLEPDFQERLLSLFHYALRPSGYLVLGLSEDVGRASHLFAVVNKKHRIYSKKAAAERPQLVLPPGSHASPLADRPEAESAPLRPEDIGSAADRAVVARYAPASVVVDGDLNIRQFRGRVGQFLEPAPGQPSHNLQRMAREGLQVALPALVRRAKKTGSAVRQDGLRVKSNGGSQQVSVEVVPFAVTPGAKDRLFLVVFDEGLPAAGPRPPAGRRAGAVTATKVAKGRARKGARQPAQLDQELAEAREHLQVVMTERDAHNEELTAALEELQSSNEELQSANEELRSTNEELQTTQEEVQSANEELVTLNEELETRNREINEALSQLHNVLESVSMPIMWVGGDLRIRMFNPAAEKVLSVVTTDIGRPIGAIKTRLDLAELEPLMAEAMDHQSRREQEVQDREGRWWSLRVRPFRTGDHTLDGVLLIWIDISAVKASLAAMTEARDYLEAIVQTVRQPLLVLDGELRVQTANQSFYETFRVGPEETQQRLVYELGEGQWDLPELRRLLGEILPKASQFEGFEVQHDFPRIGRLVMLLNARRLRTGQDGRELILLALEDVTLIKQLTELAQLRQWSTRLEAAREEERGRLARDLHDELGAALTGLKMELWQVLAGLTPDQDPLRERAQDMSGQIDALVQIVRELATDLRPPVLDRLGLPEAIEWQLGEFQKRVGIPARLTSSVETLALRPEALTAAFRVFQETLTNIARHAQATQVDVALEQRAGHLVLIVHDNGRGIRAEEVSAPGALGIAGMRERIRQVEGEIDIRGAPGEGTTVLVKIPLVKGSRARRR